jgi:hypothetical protein
MKNAPRDKMFRGASQTVEKARKVKETSGEKLEKGVVNPFFI